MSAEKPQIRERKILTPNDKAYALLKWAISTYPQDNYGGPILLASRLLKNLKGENKRGELSVSISELAHIHFDPQQAKKDTDEIHRAMGLPFEITEIEATHVLVSTTIETLLTLWNCAVDSLWMSKTASFSDELNNFKIVLTPDNHVVLNRRARYNQNALPREFGDGLQEWFLSNPDILQYVSGQLDTRAKTYLKRSRDQKVRKIREYEQRQKAR